MRPAQIPLPGRKGNRRVGIRLGLFALSCAGSATSLFPCWDQELDQHKQPPSVVVIKFSAPGRNRGCFLVALLLGGEDFAGLPARSWARPRRPAPRQGRVHWPDPAVCAPSGILAATQMLRRQFPLR